MTRCGVLEIGALFLVLTVVILFAGCTQPAGGPAATYTPTPTTIPAREETEALKAEVALIAANFAEEIDTDVLAAAIAEGPGSASYATVLEQLVALRETDPRLAYVYTIEQQDGTVWFIVEATHGGLAYLHEYTDAPGELKVPVTAPIGVGPYTDSWGTFVSGFAPVDIGWEETTVLIGVDIPV